MDSSMKFWVQKKYVKTEITNNYDEGEVPVYKIEI